MSEPTPVKPIVVRQGEAAVARKLSQLPEALREEMDSCLELAMTLFEIESVQYAGAIQSLVGAVRHFLYDRPWIACSDPPRDFADYVGTELRPDALKRAMLGAFSGENPPTYAWVCLLVDALEHSYRVHGLPTNPLDEQRARLVDVMRRATKSWCACEQPTGGVMEPTEKQREDRVRRRLAKRGEALRKDRAQSFSLDHQGGYMIIDRDRNAVVAGERFDMNLDQVESYASDD